MMNDYKPSLDRLAALARERPTLLASLFVAYREQEGLDEDGLAAFLGCAPEMLPRLALCRRPRQAPHFREDVERIASYAHANAIQLARLVRAGESWEAAHQARGASSPMLLAARDHETAGRDGSSDQGKSADEPLLSD
jgi:hypothetical protein